MATPLTDEEKERIRYHLGYPTTSFVASMQFGVPKPLQTLFLVEEAINNQLQDEFAVNRVRRILHRLDNIEAEMDGARDTLAASKLGELSLRGEPGKTYPDLLEREYERWGQRLADILGVPVYPYSGRYGRGAKSGSIPRRG